MCCNKLTNNVHSIVVVLTLITDAFTLNEHSFVVDAEVDGIGVSTPFKVPNGSLNFFRYENVETLDFSHCHADIAFVKDSSMLSSTKHHVHETSLLEVRCKFAVNLSDDSFNIIVSGTPITDIFTSL